MKSKRAALVVVLVWAGALGLGLVAARRLPAVAITDPLAFFPPDAPSRRAREVLARAFPGTEAASQVVVVLEAEGRREEHRDRVAALAERLRGAFPAAAVPRVFAPTDDPVLAERLASRDGRAALLVLPLGAGFASEEASRIVAEVEGLVAHELAGAPGLRAAFSGDATLGRDYLAAIEEGARRSAGATVLLVAGILLAVYRSPVAVLVSLGTLGAALGVGLGLVTGLAELGLPVAFQSRAFLVAIVYGVGTDYCLLLFARLREEIAASPTSARDDPAALARALRATLPVLATSAAAVVLACALMGLARFGLFRFSGPALAVGVAVAALAVATLLPAAMRLLGAALFWPTRPTPRAGWLWPRIARLVLSRPALASVLGLALLAPPVLLGLRVTPSFELELDIPAGSPSEAGYAALARHFEPAEVSPLTVLLEAPGPAAEGAGLRSTGGLDLIHQVTEALAAEPGIARVWSATRPTGEAGRLDRALLGRQIEAIEAGLARAGGGAAELAAGLDRARSELSRGRTELATRERELEAERSRSLVAPFVPERYDAAKRDLSGLGAQLETLVRGLDEAEAGAGLLADGIGRAEARLHALRTAPGADRLLDRLALTKEDQAALPDLSRALDHFVSGDGRATRFELRLAHPPNAPEAVAIAAVVREKVPIWAEGQGVRDTRVWLGGPTPITADLAAMTRADDRRLQLWIVLGVLALLIALLRGVRTPLVVTAFILASYLAALGALRVGVALGVWPALDWKVPFFLFVLLVAIGADYGVFLLGRAREEERALDFPAALTKALVTTGPVVSCCGLVLAGTFATLLLSRIAFLEQVGVGITVGVLVDTLLVRPFLLPAAALLLHPPR